MSTCRNKHCHVVDCVWIEGPAICTTGESLCFWCRRLRLGLVAGQKADLELEASTSSAAVSTSRRRTAPACQPEYRPRYTAPALHSLVPSPLHCIALHPGTIHLLPLRPPTSPPPTPPPLPELSVPPPSSEQQQQHSTHHLLLPASPTLAIQPAACNHHLMLRHNPRSFPDPPATLLAAPLATGIGFGHAACPAI